MASGLTTIGAHPRSGAAVYLASEESRFVNGTVIDVDGGRVGVAVNAG